MAGSNPSFNAANFRTQIKATMRMGLPTNVADQATFVWEAVKTYANDDPNANPYNLAQAPTTSSQHANVRVDVAVEMLGNDLTDTSVGQINNQHARITVLDEDYAQIVGATKVLLGQNTYEINFVSPPIGLFEVTVYQMDCTAIDEN